MKHSAKSIFVATLFALAVSAQALAAPDIEITDRLTWDVIGLDSNNEVNSGPDTFAVGYRICNTGDQIATNVLSTFAWESANTYINLSPGGSPTINIGSLDPAACYDAYYNVTVDRDDDARETARRYRIDVSSTGLPTVSTPIDASNYVEIYIENLISQNRNSIDSITGPNVVYRGQTYTFVLTGSTATQGYEQLESFINFPNNIFRIISVESQYSAPVDPTINDRFYSDSCGWEHDPESPNYFTNGTNGACDTGDKAGGDITLTYQIEIIGTGSATVTGLIYDFSGSSFHYNTDYGSDILSIEARELPSLTISDASQSEGNSGTSQLSFTVTLSETKTEAITFNYATSNSGAEAGVDYTATTGSVTIPANTLAATINVPVLGDLDVELDEQFTLTLSNPSGATISDGTATGAILNDDIPPPPPVNLTIGDAAITEGGNLAFPITFDNPSNTDTSITFRTTNGTAVGADYTTADVTIVISAGAVVGSVTIPTTSDTIDEPDETMSLSVRSVNSGSLNSFSDTGLGTILDNDGTPDIAIGDANITEGGSLSFPVTLSNPSSQAITVTFRPTAGTASVSDFTTTDVQVTFAAGQTAGTALIPTTNDSIDEQDESMTLAVRSVDSGTVGSTSDTGTGTINDNDGAPSLTIADATIAEGGVLQFGITLSNPSASDTTVTFQTAVGSASANDFTTTGVQITIPAGQTSGTVSIPTTPDNIDESSETMTLSVASVDSGTLGDTTDTATGTITDDDGAPDVTIGDVSVTEAGTLVFPVSLNNPSSTDATITFRPSNITASASDYATDDVQLTILAGQTVATVSIATTDDLIDESDETLTLAVQSVDAGTLGDTTDSGIGTILDDDGLPILTIADATIAEAGTLAFAVTLSNPSSQDATITFRPTNGTASNSDYTTADVQITIPAGQTSATVNIPTSDDLLDESDETVFLAVQSVGSGSLGDTSDTATGTITDDDGSPSVSIGDASISESGTLLFPITLSNPSAQTIILTFQPTNGTASSGDYTTANVQITIPAGQTSATVGIPTTPDLVDESDETITLSVLSVDAGDTGDTSDTGTGTIIDDDGAPGLTIADASITEGGDLVFSVSLSNPAAQDIVVTFQTTNGTASDTDYSTANVQVTIPAGQTSVSITVPTTPDSLDESDETMTLSVRSVDTGTLGDTSDTGTGTITDDDGAPGLTIDDVSVTEGGDLVFQITLSNPSSTATTITFQPSNGTASSTDYDTAAQQITIPANVTTATVAVPTVSDSDDESDETIILSLTSVDAGILGDISDTGTGTILDDDGTPTLTIDDAVADEGVTLVFSVTLSNPSTEDITIIFETSHGTTSDDDYNLANVEVTIPAGDLIAEVNIPTFDDTQEESDEILTLSVQSVTAGTLGDTSDTGAGTITDNDVASIELSVNAVCINDTPYVEYDVTAVNFTPQNLATIDWVAADGLVVQTLIDQSLTGGRLLWPEAAVDDAGNPTDWPGWDFVNGEWIQVPSTVRPSATLRISVNPTSEVTLSYPPVSPVCVAEPPGTSARATSGSMPPMPVPVMGPLALITLSLTLAGVATYTRQRR